MGNTQHSEVYSPGDVIGGRFQVQRKIGEGGFGLVYLAYDRQFWDFVALKTWRDEFLEHPGIREEFRREALRWVGLGNCPFILSARGVDELSGRLFVSMDYIPPDEHGCTTLLDHIETRGSVERGQCLEWAVQFCQAMQYANGRGITAHRDIKPANILIARDGAIRVSDFGLAIATEKSSRDRAFALRRGGDRGDQGMRADQPKRRGVCGTRGYIAPELFDGGLAGQRSDIFSFGAVLWQMVTGRNHPPFDVQRGGDNKVHLIEYSTRTSESPLPGPLSQVSGPLDSVIRQCLALIPQERVQDFATLQKVLTDLQSHSNAGAVVVPPSAHRNTEERSSFAPHEYFGAFAGLWRHVARASPGVELAAQTWEEIKRARNLRALAQLEEAVHCLDRGLQNDPKSVVAWLEKGQTLRLLGRTDDALSCYDRALELDSSSADAAVCKGILLNLLGRHAEALACMDHALQYHRLDPSVWTAKGHCFHFLGQHTEAVVCFDHALEIDQRLPEVWNSKGHALHSLGRKHDALACFSRALQMDPGNVDALIGAGTCCESLRRYDEALACNDKALLHDPKHITALINKSIILHVISRYLDAISCCDKALQINRRSAAAWTNKANSLNSLQRYAEAMVCLDEALQIDAEDTSAWNNKGLSLYGLGRYDEAIVCLDRAVSIDPRYAPAWNNRAVVLKQLGRYEEAIASCNKAIAIDPEYVAPWRNKANCLCLLGLHAEAASADARASMLESKGGTE